MKQLFCQMQAMREYRQFVSWGINKETIWTEVKGQILPG